ncbi:MAG: CorA family divalent cation transporter, partial [Candidatus Saccharimonas aalborgensis]
VEKCNDNIKAIVGVRNAHSSISDNSLNQTMKVLTVATLAMAIPNMIFGVYSMNIETPFQHDTGAFWIILGITTIVLTIAMWLGRKKGIF